MYKPTAARSLPIYDRAIARYPHLASVVDAKAFCQALCRLEAVETITIREYMRIAAVAEGSKW